MKILFDGDEEFPNVRRQKYPPTWISVKDKLPEKGQSVLALALYRISPEFDLSNSMYVAWIEKFGIENKPVWQYSWCCGCYCGESITHWMPLPSLPQESPK